MMLAIHSMAGANAIRKWHALILQLSHGFVLVVTLT